jgi:hypothetical protein
MPLGAPCPFTDRRRQPSSNVWGAVAKHDAPTGFMLAEKAEGLVIGQDQVCTVKHHHFAGE